MVVERLVVWTQASSWRMALWYPDLLVHGLPMRETLQYQVPLGAETAMPGIQMLGLQVAAL